MQRRGSQLNSCWRYELRASHAGYSALHILAELGVDVWREQRGHVEARKDGHTVARREESVARHRNGSGDDAWRAKHSHKDLVLVDARANVCSRRGEEL